MPYVFSGLFFGLGAEELALFSNISVKKTCELTLSESQVWFLAQKHEWDAVSLACDSFVLSEELLWRVLLLLSTCDPSPPMSLASVRRLLLCYQRLLSGGDQDRFGELAYFVFGQLQHRWGLVRSADGVRVHLSQTDISPELLHGVFEEGVAPWLWVGQDCLPSMHQGQLHYRDGLWTAVRDSTSPLTLRLQNRCYGSLYVWQRMEEQGRAFWEDFSSLRSLLVTTWVDSFLLKSMLSRAPNNVSAEHLRAQSATLLHSPIALKAVQNYAESPRCSPFVV